MADNAMIEQRKATPLQIQLKNSIVTKEFCQQAEINDLPAIRALTRSSRYRNLFV